jgi:hypothetical protein
LATSWPLRLWSATLTAWRADPLRVSSIAVIVFNHYRRAGAGMDIHRVTDLA